MPSPDWRQADLPELAASLARRPGHENTRVQVADILRHGFGVRYAALDHEVRMPEVRGRADMLFGAVVFEFKADLRKEMGDVAARLPDYLAERERRTGRQFLGIATDGATFAAYELRAGALREIGRHELRADDPEALLAWLDTALSDRDELAPEPLVVRRELGRESLTFGRASASLDQLWAGLRDRPEVALKRQLWDGLLREAYGAPVGDDTLFLQHTYLTIVAKTLAARVLDLPTDDAAAILSGQALAQAGIRGAVEGDFFDWVLLDPAGQDLVRRLARQVSRFRLRDVEADVLKALYESLIDPAQRHDLGEYYTPDWLAAKIVAATLADPLRATVLDPACGSGTFLFHALRRLLAAARAAGWSDARAVREAAARVRGLDVHPVAVIIARVTWLLALGEAVRERNGDLHVPVYLGDALQWNLSQIGDVREVMLPVPGEEPLHVPAGVAERQETFEPALRELTEGLEAGSPPEQVERALARIPGVGAADAATLAGTFAMLREIFPTSSCVVIARRQVAGKLPAEVALFTGAVRRDAGEDKADRALVRVLVPWPPMTTLQGASPYRERFRNGATIYPRRFFLVERDRVGRLGASRTAPRVRGRVGSMDKAPWTGVPPPAGPVETLFLRPLLLGESIVPFRLLEPALAVVPVEGRSVYDAQAAAAAGHRYLASWLQSIELQWETHASRLADNKLRMTLQKRIDHMRGLSMQLLSIGPKLVYTKGGTHLSAALCDDTNVLIENTAYWTPVRGLKEARYLSVIINSNAVLQLVIPMQPRGWRDPRHFDKLVWELPIPDFDPDLTLHQELAAAGAEAEDVARTVALPEGDYRRKRRAIRNALAETGLAARMEALVAALLAG